MLLAAPAWRADGSDTIATATAATLSMGGNGRGPWSRQTLCDGLAFFHSSVFLLLSSLLLHTSRYHRKEILDASILS